MYLCDNDHGVDEELNRGDSQECEVYMLSVHCVDVAGLLRDRAHTCLTVLSKARHPEEVSTNRKDHVKLDTCTLPPILTT